MQEHENLIEKIEDEIKSVVKPSGIPDHRLLEILGRFLNEPFTGNYETDMTNLADVKSKRVKKFYKANMIDLLVNPCYFTDLNFVLENILMSYNGFLMTDNEFVYRKLNELVFKIKHRKKKKTWVTK